MRRTAAVCQTATARSAFRGWMFDIGKVRIEVKRTFPLPFSLLWGLQLRSVRAALAFKRNAPYAPTADHNYGFQQGGFLHLVPGPHSIGYV